MRADASEKRAEETRKELCELNETVDLLREASQGYRVVRHPFLDTYKRSRLHLRSKALIDRVNAMNKTVHGGCGHRCSHVY
jgi:hypothetical protein